MHHFTYRQGILHAEDIDLAALAASVGTPFYCYSTATLERHYRVFADAFAGLDAEVCYSVKANANLGVLATLAGFFGGMALGAAVWHRRAVSGPDPIGMFVRLELVAAGFAVVSPYLLHALGRAIPAALGPVAGANDTPTAVAVAITIAALLMLPGTLCMGATLAAVTEARRRRSCSRGSANHTR